MKDLVRDFALEASVKYFASEEWVFTDRELLHFAELIIKECAKFLEENSGYDDSNNAWHPEPEDLLKHFGVE